MSAINYVQSSLFLAPMQNLVSSMGLALNPLGFSLKNTAVVFEGQGSSSSGSIILHEPLLLSPGDNASKELVKDMADRFEIHPIRILLRPKGREAEMGFLNLWKDLQAGLFEDKTVRRDGAGELIGRVGETVGRVEGEKRVLADAIVAENEAFTRAETSPVRSRDQHSRAAKLFADYVNSSDADSWLKRHMVSRAILSAFSARDMGLASDLLGMSAELYEGGGGAELAIAAEDRVRAALAAVTARLPLAQVADHLDRGIMSWHIMDEIKSGKADQEIVDQAAWLSSLARSLSDLSVIRYADDFRNIKLEGGSYVFVHHEDSIPELRLAGSGVPQSALVIPETDSLVAAGNWQVKNGNFVFDGASDEFEVKRDSVEDLRDSGVPLAAISGLDLLKTFLKEQRIRFAVKG